MVVRVQVLIHLAGHGVQLSCTAYTISVALGTRTRAWTQPTWKPYAKHVPKAEMRVHWPILILPHPMASTTTTSQIFRTIRGFSRLIRNCSRPVEPTLFPLWTGSLIAKASSLTVLPSP